MGLESTKVLTSEMGGGERRVGFGDPRKIVINFLFRCSLPLSVLKSHPASGSQNRSQLLLLGCLGESIREGQFLPQRAGPYELPHAMEMVVLLFLHRNNKIRCGAQQEGSLLPLAILLSPPPHNFPLKAEAIYLFKLY